MTHCSGIAIGKIRLTIYNGLGPENRVGLSELFFIHPEASTAYDGLMVKYNNVGNVGIGTSSPTEKLSVDGKIRAREITVAINGWADYVFDEAYQLGTLSGLEKYVKLNKRLPEIPSAKEVEKNGVELGELNRLLLKKIEELTLYIIELNKRVELVEAKNKF